MKSENISIKSISKLYYFLVNKTNGYNKNKIKEFNDMYKNLQAGILLITYVALR